MNTGTGLLPASRETVASVLILIVLASLAFPIYGKQVGVDTFFNGLTLASVLILVAIGLSIVYGLMNVLNLSHAAIFMFGAYVGTMISIRPGYLLAIAAYPLAFAAGITLKPKALADLLPSGLRSRQLGTGVALFGGVLGFATWISVTPKALPGAGFSFLALPPLPSGLVLVFAGAILSLGRSVRETRVDGDGSSRMGRVAPLILVGTSVLFMLLGDRVGDVILGLDSNVRYLLALVVAGLVGGVLGGVMESALLRPLYQRHVTQVTLTFFILLVLVEIARLFWGRNPLVMPRPGYFGGSGEGCPGIGIVQAMQAKCSSVVLFGTQMATYRLFVIFAALVLVIVVAVTLRASRTGLYVRAGVSDSEMVAALGVDIERVFNRVFTAGSALAGVGGALAAPFVGVNLDLAFTLLVSAILVVILGGLGSFFGAVMGAVLLGYASAFSNAVVLRVGLTPEFTTVATLLLLVVVLLVRPQGLWGVR